MTWKRSLRFHFFVVLTILAGVGYFAKYNETLPDYCYGILSVYMILKIGMMFVGAVIFSVIRFVLLPINFLVISKVKTNPWEESEQSLENMAECNKSVLEIYNTIKNTMVFNYKTIVDVAADWFLFAGLVIANAPITASLYTIVLLPQYFLILSLKKYMKNKLHLLQAKDESEEATLPPSNEIDIDDLMNKLTEPKPGKD